MTKYKYKIINLDCPTCAANLEKSLQKIEGIENVTINFITQKLTFECLEEEKENILKNIKKKIKKEEPDVEIEDKVL